MDKKFINELTDKPAPSDNDYVIGHDNAVPNGIRTKWVDVINKVKGALGIGLPNGVAPLDAGGNVPSEHIPFGETSTEVTPGDVGKAAWNHSQITSGNPHGITAEMIGAVQLTDASVDADGDSIAKRSANGTVRTATAENNNDAVPLSQHSSSRVMTAAAGGWFRLQFSPNTSYVVEFFSVNEASSNNTPSRALLQFKTGASVTNNVTFAAARIISAPWTGDITVFNDSGNLAVHILRPTPGAYSTVIATARSSTNYRIVPISGGGSGGVPGSATNVVTVTPAT